MTKNIRTLIIVFIIIIILSIVGSYILKVNYGRGLKNSNGLNIDSLGIIDSDKFCNFEYISLNINVKNSNSIAIDSKGIIYVSGNDSIYSFSSEGKKIKAFKTQVTATALALSNDNTLYAALVNYIVVYSSDGTMLSQWPVLNNKAYITSIAIRHGNVYIADANDALVYVYDTTGNESGTIGSKNRADKDCFILPSRYFDVAIGPDSSLWVANPGKHLLVNFNTDGTVKSSWGSASVNLEDFCGCCNPSHFAVGSDGSFITSEKGIVRVKKYNSSGIFECAIAGPQHFEAGATNLDIAIGSKSDIFILEPKAAVIHIFKDKNQ